MPCGPTAAAVAVVVAAAAQQQHWIIGWWDIGYNGRKVYSDQKHGHKNYSLHVFRTTFPSWHFLDIFRIRMQNGPISIEFEMVKIVN